MTREHRFRFGQVFRANDRDSAFVLQLLLVSNDICATVRIGEAAQRSETESPARRPLHSVGDSLYAMRMGLMHLREFERFGSAGFAQFFKTRFSSDAEALQARGADLVPRVRRLLDRLLAPVRNSIAGHYDFDSITELLAEKSGRIFNEPISFIPEQVLGELHFDATDVVTAELLGGYTVDQFRTAQTLDDAMGRAFAEIAEVQIELTRVAYEMVALLIAERVHG